MSYDIVVLLYNNHFDYTNFQKLIKNKNIVG